MHRVFAVIGFECKTQLLRLPTLAVSLIIIGYTLLMTLGSQALAELNLADTPRNSAYVIYIMSSPGGFWFLYFAAFIMSTAVSRDRDVHIGDVIYAAPGSLRGYLLGIFIGRFLTIVIVSLAIPLSFLVMPFVIADPSAVGPTQWPALLHGYGVFLFVLVFSLSGLYFGVTIVSGKSAYAWAAAFFLTVMWMVGDLVLIGADVARTAGHLIDPMQHALVQAEIDQWTAVERQSAVLPINPVLLANRVLYIAVGLGFAIAAIGLADRERLLAKDGGKVSKAKHMLTINSQRALACFRPSLRAPMPSLMGRIRLALALTKTHVQRLVFSGAFLALLGFAFLTLVTTGAYKINGTEAGPILPWTSPVWVDFYRFMYLPAALFLCYSAARLIRPERGTRFSELVDATGAPTWLLIAPKILALIVISLVLAVIPSAALSVVQATLFPAALRLADFAPTLLFSWPIYIQIGLLGFVIYGLVMNKTMAHFLAFFAVCVLIFNQEARLVDTSLTLYGMLIHADYSHLQGWQVWIRPALHSACWFMGLIALACVIMSYLWPRGSDIGLRQRMQQHSAKARALTGLALTVFGWFTAYAGQTLYDTVVVQNGYQSHTEIDALKAAYEKTYGTWRDGPSLAAVAASTAVALDLTQSAAAIDYSVTLENQQDRAVDALLIEWPDNTAIEGVAIAGEQLSLVLDNALQTAVITLPNMVGSGQRVRLDFSISARWQGFKNRGEVHPISASGVWLSGADLLPKFGYQRRREVASPARRSQLGLAPRRPIARQSNVYLYPATDYSNALTLSAISKAGLTAVLSGQSQKSSAPKSDFQGRDFAIAIGDYASISETWQSAGEPVDVTVLHHGMRRPAAQVVLREVLAILDSFTAQLGPYKHSALTIVQAPNHQLKTGLYGDLLVLEEEAGWDINPATGIYPALRFHLAQALAQHWWHDQVRPARSAGYALVSAGLPAAFALHYLAESDDPNRISYAQSRPSDFSAELLQIQMAVTDMSILSDELPAEADAYVGAFVLRKLESNAGAPGALRAALSGAQTSVQGLTRALQLTGPLTLFDIGLIGPVKRARNQLSFGIEGRKLTLGSAGWVQTDMTNEAIEIGFVSADNQLSALHSITLLQQRTVTIPVPHGLNAAGIVLDPRGLLGDLNPRDNALALTDDE